MRNVFLIIGTFKVKYGNHYDSLVHIKMNLAN